MAIMLNPMFITAQYFTILAATGKSKAFKVIARLGTTSNIHTSSRSQENSHLYFIQSGCPHDTN